METSIAPSKPNSRKIRYETKIDIRIPREISDELSLMADYRHTSKSSLTREIVMERVGLLRKDPDYRRFVKNSRKLGDQGTLKSPRQWFPPQLDFPGLATREATEQVRRKQEQAAAEPHDGPLAALRLRRGSAPWTAIGYPNTADRR